MDVEPVRGVRPGGHVARPRTGLAAAGAEQLPRGSLCGVIRVQWNLSRLFVCTTL